MKKLVKWVYIWLPIIIFLGLVFRTKRDKDGMIKIGNTIIVMKNYDQKKDLSVQDRLGFESEVKKYDDLIKNFKPGTGEEKIDLGSGLVGMAKVGRKPESERFIQKASNLTLLGRYNDAIKTINSMSHRFVPDAQIWNVFGTLYDEVGEYKMAIKYYQQIMDTNKDYVQPMMFKIISDYIALKDGESAGKLYVQYITKDGGSKDPQIEKQIQTLNFPAKD